VRVEICESSVTPASRLNNPETCCSTAAFSATTGNVGTSRCFRWRAVRRCFWFGRTATTRTSSAVWISQN